MPMFMVMSTLPAALPCSKLTSGVTSILPSPIGLSKPSVSHSTLPFFHSSLSPLHSKKSLTSCGAPSGITGAVGSPMSHLVHLGLPQSRNHFHSPSNSAKWRSLLPVEGSSTVTAHVSGTVVVMLSVTQSHEDG